MNFKKYLKPVLTGIIITIIMALVMGKITMNFQILLFLGTIVFFVGGILNTNNQSHFLINTFLITTPYLALFSLFVLNEIPKLWYFIPIYFIAALLGIIFKEHKKMVLVISPLLVSVILFLAIKTIPADLENSLTRTRFDKLPTFTLQDMSGNTIDSESLNGKVVVLDFFGTWCAPCIKELRELDKVKKTFQDNEDVVFLIVNADINDTPEKFKAFIEKNNYTFNFAYDYNSIVYKKLNPKSSGLPVLFIIDKNQNIRLQHIGYNPAETNFTIKLIETINELIR